MSEPMEIACNYLYALQGQGYIGIKYDRQDQRILHFSVFAFPTINPLSGHNQKAVLDRIPFTGLANSADLHGFQYPRLQQ